MTNLATVTGLLAASSQDNWYSVTLSSTQMLNLDLQAGFGSASLTLVDAAGKTVASSASSSVTRDGWINQVLAAGTYYIDVNSNGDAKYTLAATTGTPDTGTIGVDTAGQTLTTARPLGTIGTTPLTIAEAIGGPDPVDYYAFNVSTTSQVRATVSGLSNSATFYILNAAGQTILSGSGGATSNITLSQALAPLTPGTYFFEVADNNSASTGYALDVSATSAVTAAGPTPGGAFSLGTLGTTAAQHADKLSPVSETEYYSFSVGATSRVSVSVSGLTDYVTLRIRDAAGNPIAGVSGDYSDGTINLGAYLPPLSTGTYFISVEGGSAATTSYTLTASAAAIADNGGDTFDTATPLGVVSAGATVATDFIGDVDTTDIYAFTLASAATLSADLSTYTKDVAGRANLTLYNANQRPITDTSYASPRGDDDIFSNLAAGTYYAVVNRYGNTENTPYTLTLTTAAPAVGTPASQNGGPTLATARDLGTLTAAGVKVADWVGTGNTTDWYKVTVGSVGILRLNLTGLSGYADLILTDLTGATVSSSRGYDAKGAAVWGSYAPGTYFVEVSSPLGMNSGYSLSAALQPIADGAGNTTATGRAIGALGTTAQTFSDYVGPQDSDDYYQFTLASTSVVNLRLAGLSNYATLLLRDVSGNQISSDQGNDQADAFRQRVLPAGTYFADVSSPSYANDYTLTLSATPLANQASTLRATAAPLVASPTPTPTPIPTPTPAATLVPVATVVASYVPPSLYATAASTAAAKALAALAGAPGTVTVAASASAPFPAAQAGAANVAVATAPAAGAALALPAGYGGLLAQGADAATLSDAGAAGALLVGNGGGDTFNSTGAGVTLVGGQGANVFNVSGSATVVTGDGKNTVQAVGSAALNVTTGAGGSTVVLGGGPSTVQSNGPDTVFGGDGTSTITAGKGLVAVGGAGRMSFAGGSATSLVFGGSGGVNYTGGSAYDIVVGIGGPLNVQAGSGGGQFWGNGGGDVLRAGSGQAVLFGSNGDKLYSAGAAGNFLVAGAGNVTEDGSAATGNDVFFGGTGADTIIAGSGNVLIGTGSGTSTVQLGSGKATVFAFGTSTVAAGSGSADIVMGGSVQLAIQAGAARSFALFNFVPGTDRIALSGYNGGTVASALATQVTGGGQTVLTLSDNSHIQLIGVARADASFFA